jgi:hypothetical protein
LQSDRPEYKHFQCANIQSNTYSQSPRPAPTNTLKGQNPSAVGTALGNAAHNKTRPNGATALIPNFKLLIPHSLNFRFTSIEIIFKTLSLQEENFSVWSRR